MKSEHQKALVEARAEGHSAGFAEAGEAYATDIYNLVEDGKQRGFGKGYLYAMDVLKVSEDPICLVVDDPESPIAEAVTEAEGEADASASQEQPLGDTPPTPAQENSAVNLSP